MTKTQASISRLERWLPWVLVVGGIVGLICSAVLSFDEIKLLKDANFQPSCNLNPVVSCGSVMKSNQASVFGFPNPFIGLALFPVLLTIGAGLLAGAKFKKWFWLGLNFGALLGLVFVHWLFFQTVYRINALCPYCMVVWVVTITSFWYVTLYNLGQSFAKLPPTCRKIASFIRRHHLDILILWFVILLALILKHFWYYYGRYF